MTEPETDPVPDAVVRVHRDLRVIENLAGDHTATGAHVGRVSYRNQLRTQAVHKGSDRLMPGGLAMVALADVSNLEQWAHKLDTAEQNAVALSWRTGTRTKWPEIEDDDDWDPPLQTLQQWSEPLRTALDMEFEPSPGRPRPSIASEVNFLRWAADMAYQNLPTERFAAFERDINRTRTRLENLLRTGVRAERGVPCLYEECGGRRLVRKLIPGRDEDGNKIWYHSKWHCPRCHRQWDEDQYARMKTAAAEAAKIEQIPGLDADDPGDTWCSVDYAAQRTGRPAATIRVWAHRGRVASVCLLAGQRRGYVRLADVDEQHAIATRRAEAVRAGKQRKRKATHVL